MTGALARLRAAVNDKLWVNPEYAREFAVLSAWLSALLPWSLTYASREGATLFQMRFPFVMVQYVSGVPLVEAFQLSVANRAADVQRSVNPGLGTAYDVWFVGSLLLALAVLLSLLLYAELDLLDRHGEMAPVRAMGALLLLAGLVMTVSDYYLWHNAPGTQIPVFTAFYYVFAVALLSIEEP
jgi:hypothetical protein